MEMILVHHGINDENHQIVISAVIETYPSS